jgi:hypothetical protein
MKLNDLIHKAATAYPDARLLAYWDGRRAVSNPVDGDTLAEFIVRELCDTFDAKAGTGEQVAEAVRVLRRAVGNLEGVIARISTAVENSKRRRKPSSFCSLASLLDHAARQDRRIKARLHLNGGAYTTHWFQSLKRGRIRHKSGCDNTVETVTRRALLKAYAWQKGAKCWELVPEAGT